jgi:serine/threonine protein phosphatase PrpC
MNKYFTIFMDKGSRSEQADSISINNTIYHESFIEIVEPALFPVTAILCDGMGGDSKGKISKFFCENIYTVLHGLPSFSKENILGSIGYAHTKSLDVFKDCGSTVSLAVFHSPTDYSIASIGDSAIYGISKKCIKLLTKRQAIRNFLQAGVGPKFKDLFSINLIQFARIKNENFDSILICSDGVINSNLVSLLDDFNDWDRSLFMEKVHSTLFTDNASFIVLQF